jgi:hypothetical protein
VARQIAQTAPAPIAWESLAHVGFQPFCPSRKPDFTRFGGPGRKPMIAAACRQIYPTRKTHNQLKAFATAGNPTRPHLRSTRTISSRDHTPGCPRAFMGCQSLSALQSATIGKIGCDPCRPKRVIADRRENADRRCALPDHAQGVRLRHGLVGRDHCVVAAGRFIWAMGLSQRLWGRAAGLLHHVGELVSDQLAARTCLGRVSAGGEHEVAAGRVRAGADL